MTNQELIDQVAATSGETKKTVGAVIDALSGVVTDALKERKEVTLPGIGKFDTADRAARSGRNPQTGTEIEIPACVAPTFKASSTLKNALNA